MKFCNEHSSADITNRLELKELEFVHCSLLESGDTAEASALMKNDRIQVKKRRQAERDCTKRKQLLQREADRHYFEQLRNLMPDHIGASCCDILLDCQGKLVDENGLNQEVLRTGLRGHSHILAKRCKWLSRKIQQSRDELGRKSVVTIPDHDGQRSAESDEDGIVMPFPAVQLNELAGGAAAQIENDDDEEAISNAGTSRSGSPILSLSGNLLYVTIPFPPPAVAILIEYCYTNRVIPLGRDAFEIASHPNHQEEGAPVSPLDRQWPDKGRRPKVTFAVALAGIALAEEASMRRLSLMCEVAAAQLVNNSNVVSALSMCATQENLTGNCLSRLRKAAMVHVLRGGVRGVSNICNTSVFSRALSSSSVFVPSLLKGAAEILSPDKDKPLPPAEPFDSADLQDYFSE